jgi:hypothetical protein
MEVNKKVHISVSRLSARYVSEGQLAVHQYQPASGADKHTSCHCGDPNFVPRPPSLYIGEINGLFIRKAFVYRNESLYFR